MNYHKLAIIAVLSCLGGKAFGNERLPEHSVLRANQYFGPNKPFDPAEKDHSIRDFIHFDHSNPHGPKSLGQESLEQQAIDHHLDHINDPAFRYRIIDINNEEAMKLLEDPKMRIYLDQYLKGQEADLAYSKKKCEEAELKDKYFLSKVFDYNNREKRRRRLSFINRLEKGLAEKKAPKSFGPSVEGVSQQPMKITDVTDMVSTTVTTIDHINPELSKALQEVSLEFQSVSEFDFDAHYKQIESNLAKMEQAGLFKNPESKSLLLHGFKHFFESLKPNDPRENPREFALNVVKYTGLIAFHSLTGGAFVPAQMAISIGLQAQRVMSLDTENMTGEQIAEALAEELAIVAWDIAVAKAAPAIKDKAVKLGSTILKRVKPGNLEQAVLKTAEGVAFKAPQAMEEASVLKNGAEKSTSGKLLVVNQSPVAVLKDGYYEVNGFKFSEYYYNRLWNAGRKAPSLAARAILENTIEILPDPKGYPGFYKYVSDGWYMIYNPSTKIISHLEPLK